MHGRLLLLALAGGCGRFGFSDRTSDAGHDAGRDAPRDTLPIGDGGICHAGAWSTPVPVASTVTASEEADPSISADDLELFFESNRVGGQGRAIWTATRATPTAAFGAASLVAALDSGSDEDDPELSPDGLTLYFSSNRSGTFDIYVATRPTPADPFTFVGPLPLSDSASTVRSGPAVTGDDLTMFFTRNGIDVAVASRPDMASTFTFDRQLAEVNVPSSDGNPTITADELELFFDSYRTGAAAIFTATRASTTAMFSAPAELPELVGSGSAAGTPEISSDGRTIYYFDKVNGQLDLYMATRACP